MATSHPGITLDAQGYFFRNGRRVIPVGVNYWPGSCGVEVWQQWPEAELQHDLDLIRDLGLNSLRFFLRWPDFEPTLGHYDETMFARLTQFLGWCAERDLLVQPTLFVGFMSGGYFWPADKGGRNLYADPDLRLHCQAYARKAAAVIAPYHAHVLGIDLGNELGCTPDHWSAPPAAVIEWCGDMSAAIRSAYPESLVVSGLDGGQVHADGGWRLGNQPGTDFYSMHTYPVPSWNAIAFDGMTDPLCQSILPLYTQIGRAFGPTMVQEFGTILTAGTRQPDAYLRAMLPACWQAGANGFLWWCLRDIPAAVYPYTRCGMESRLGLVDAQDRVKAGLAYYLEFCHSLADAPLPVADPQAIGLYWPRYFYAKDVPANPGNQPGAVAKHLLVANYLLRQAGYTTRIVRGDEPLPSDCATLVIPGAHLDTGETDALESWVRAGGHALWHGPRWHEWGPGYARVLGASPVDLRAPKPIELSLFEHTWRLAHYPDNVRAEVLVETAEVLAHDADGLPMVLRNRLGAGAVLSALPVVEETIASLATDRAARDEWAAWYAGMLAVLGRETVGVAAG
jgi:hypothetical protein